MTKRCKQLSNQSKRDESPIKGQSLNNNSLNKFDENFRFSFQFLDRTQGQSLEEWNENGNLLKMNQTLLAYCNEPIKKQFNRNFKEYGEFPKKSGFTPPKYIDDDVNWASLHITGKVVLGGFIYNNTFFIVFLDEEHKFYICEKKHT